jgi:hypothetical protein
MKGAECGFEALPIVCIQLLLATTMLLFAHSSINSKLIENEYNS